jgi:Holliday junction resolvase RusA-like endonuclease
LAAGPCFPRKGVRISREPLARCRTNKAALDIDNRVKAVFDACTHGKVWLDDSQVDEMHAYRMPPDPENPHVRIMILEL